MALVEIGVLPFTRTIDFSKRSPTALSMTFVSKVRFAPQGYLQPGLTYPDKTSISVPGVDRVLKNHIYVELEGWKV